MLKVSSWERLVSIVAGVLLAVLSLSLILLPQSAHAEGMTARMSLYQNQLWWQGNGTYNNGNPPFQMIVKITVQGGSLSGTLEEPTYNDTIVSVSGTASTNSDGSVAISFTSNAYIQGNSICLNCTYNAVYNTTSMNGTWMYPGNTTPDGTFSLTKFRNSISFNPYPDSTQCTWRAEDLMHNASGLYMPNFGDAHSWRDNAGLNGWTVGTTPETSSVMVMQYADSNGNPYKYWYWNGSQWVQTHISPVGHVGWVTNIGNGGSEVYIVDRNWNEDGRDGGRWIWIIGAPVNFIYSSH